MKNKVNAFLFIFMLPFLGCDKGSHWILQPTNHLFLQPNVSGKILTHEELIKIKGFIINEKGERSYDPGYTVDSQYVFDAADRYDSRLAGKGILSVGIAYFAHTPEGNLRSGTCYLEYPDGDIDTVHVVTEKVSDEQGVKERCYCSSPIREVKINGKICGFKDISGVQDPVFYYEKK